MIPLRKPLIFAAAALAALCSVPKAALALGSFGGDWTTGNGYRGWDVKGDTDFDKDGKWGGSASYAYAHSNTGTESRSNQFTAGINHTLDEQWGSRASFTGWEDTINDVQYVGPSFGFTLTRYADPEAVDESYKIAFDNDLFLYKAQTPSSRLIRFRRRLALTSPSLGSASMGEWRPQLNFEKPLPFAPKVIPWTTVSHYFYTKNPDIIEQRAGQPRFSAYSNSVSGLANGLFNNTATVGVDVKLPAHLRLSVALGVEQQATDNTWSTTQSAGITGLFFDHWHANLSWNRTIQDGLPQDLVTAGSAWWF